MSQYTETIKVTEYPPHLKHKTIFETFNALNTGEVMLIVNDHDPKPLRFQFESMYKGEYNWEYIEQGPTTFQIAISKL